jgi:hypothetical protein
MSAEILGDLIYTVVPNIFGPQCVTCCNCCTTGLAEYENVWKELFNISATVGPTCPHSLSEDFYFVLQNGRLCMSRSFIPISEPTCSDHPLSCVFTDSSHKIFVLNLSPSDSHCTNPAISPFFY